MFAQSLHSLIQKITIDPITSPKLWKWFVNGFRIFAALECIILTGVAYGYAIRGEHSMSIFDGLLALIALGAYAVITENQRSINGTK